MSRVKLPRYLYAQKGDYIIFAHKRTTAKLVPGLPFYTGAVDRPKRYRFGRYTVPRCCPGCGSVVMVGNGDKTESFYVQKDIVLDTKLLKSGCIDCMSKQDPQVEPELMLLKLTQDREAGRPKGAQIYSGMVGMRRGIAKAMLPILNCAPLDAYADRRKRDGKDS